MVSRGYVPAPLSIYRRIFKLTPGCVLTVDADVARQPLEDAPAIGSSSGISELHAYWSYLDVVEQGARDPFKDEREAIETVEAALCASIAGQSLADVPVGSFLSGGIDSSTITALYQLGSSRPVHSFSIGFAEDPFNEADHAKRVADHLGAVHHEHYVTLDEARAVIPELPRIYDEPFADASQIPTFLVSRFARTSVTVALSGDGGDELFGGYNRHLMIPRLWRYMRRIPLAARRGALAPLAALSPALLGWSGWRRETPEFGRKVQKALRVASGARTLDEVVAAFLDQWQSSGSPVVGGRADALPIFLPLGEAAEGEQRLMAYDALTYLPGDILCKVDRASMAVSLEARVPFLDHRVAAAAARIPTAMNFDGRQGKNVLRAILARHVPTALTARPKAGFAVPIGSWLRSGLRDWAEGLLSRTALKESGVFDPDAIEARWHGHLSGRQDAAGALWPVLMFQAWQKDIGRREI
jgi:asparagine synthase (glutamine-hydrolysing)